MVQQHVPLFQHREEVDLFGLTEHVSRLEWRQRKLSIPAMSQSGGRPASRSPRPDRRRMSRARDGRAGAPGDRADAVDSISRRMTSLRRRRRTSRSTTSICVWPPSSSSSNSASRARRMTADSRIVGRERAARDAREPDPRGDGKGVSMAPEPESVASDSPAPGQSPGRWVHPTRVLEDQRKIQAERRQKRERTGLVDSQRRQDRKDRVPKYALNPSRKGPRSGPRQQLNLFRRRAPAQHPT